MIRKVITIMLFFFLFISSTFLFIYIGDERFTAWLQEHGNVRFVAYAVNLSAWMFFIYLVRPFLFKK